ncbi:hypothetical protein [Vibrio crassostreae]|uniref:hypothetical protein n=1 Tax=Vibrio crassostreae TaxID=246167 RepID=UPI001B307651|nr:hypothetical protein [Vibrio crassostreae]
MKKLQKTFLGWKFRLAYLSLLSVYTLVTAYLSIEAGLSLPLMLCHLAFIVVVWFAAAVPRVVSGLKKTLLCLFAALLIIVFIKVPVGDLNGFKDAVLFDKLSMLLIREYIGLTMYYIMLLKTFIHAVFRF